MFAKQDNPIPTEVNPTLVKILGWPRPHGSQAEIQFRTWLKAQILEITGQEPEVLAHGCIYVHVNHLSGSKSTTMFSCHVDTMDANGDGKLVDDLPVMKTLTYDPNLGIVGLAKDSPGSCLGADDGAGIWIMLNMMRAKVAGGYMFHTEEERGGVGARAILAKHKELLKTFEVAVAFDRPGDYEVITHQGGVECASAKFANALARMLREAGLTQYVTSTRGVFTDTKVYKDIIAECTNIGVGYTGQHGKGEDLDYQHLERLNKACVELNWQALPVDRDPSEVAISNYSQYTSKTPPWPTVPPKKTAVAKKYKVLESEYDVLVQADKDELAEWVVTNSEEALLAMISLITEVAQLRAEVMVLRSLAGVDTMAT